MVQLDVGRDGQVYAVDNKGGLHFRTGVTNSETLLGKAGTGWSLVAGAPGKAVDVAHCSNGIVYYVDSTGNNQLVHNTNVNAGNGFRGDGWSTIATPEVPAVVTCATAGRLLFLS